jgi:hypothetical protein
MSKQAEAARRVKVQGAISARHSKCAACGYRPVEGMDGFIRIWGDKAKCLGFSWESGAARQCGADLWAQRGAVGEAVEAEIPRVQWERRA